MGPDRFLDGRVFDPAKLVEYLAGFGSGAVKVSMDELAKLNA